MSGQADPVSRVSLPGALDRALERLIDGLCDPQRRNRAAAAFLSVYAVLWALYWTISRSSRDMNADMAEMIVWTRELSLGYPKHPPLPAGILWVWFSVFPVSDFAYTLLAVLTVCVGLYLAFRLAGEWLAGEKQAAVLFLLAVIPFYNFLGLKFDQNSLLIPLWALAMWALIRALDTRSAGWAIVCGAAAAAAMLTKYWSLFLLLALGVTALADPRRKAYFRSFAPYATVITFLVLTVPHAWWLIAHDFPPLRWVGERRSVDSLFDWMRGLSSYLLGTTGYAAAALLLFGLGARPARTALADSLWPADPARRRAAILFWTPLLAPIGVAVVTATKLVSLWNVPALNLLPVVLMNSPGIRMPRASVKVMAVVALALPAVVLAASPGVAYFKLRYGAENHALYARLVGDALTQEWHKVTGQPLRLMAGPFGLISAVAAYHPDRPSTYADFSGYLSPWVTPDRITREGLAVACPVEGRECLGHLNRLAPDAPRREVTLTRRWLWWQSAPARFVVAVVPPK
jgi:4-amino-4-deoxy-L-arabinose transferase-like glycosyltransferase